MMNEKIKALAEQAGLIASEHNNLDFKTTLTPSERKFAELIVADCLNQCSNYGGDATLVANHIARKIEEHFGIK